MNPTTEMDLVWKRTQLFSREESNADFREAALLEFFDGEHEPGAESDSDFLDYLYCEHRDGSGESLLDRLEKMQGPGFSENDRSLIEILKTSRRGLFSVVRLPEAGIAEVHSFETAELLVLGFQRDEFELKTGEVFVARIAPAGDTALLVGGPRELPGNVGALAARLADRDSALAERIASPSFLRRVLGDLSLSKDPPLTRLEAQLRVTKKFEDLGIELDVEAIESALQASKSAEAFLRSLPALAGGDKVKLHEVARAVSSLWNLTPRDDLGGASPTSVLETESKLRLVAPGTLPPSDQQVWTNAALSEMANSGKPHKALFALRRANLRSDLYSGVDLRAAARTAIECTMPAMRAQTLDALKDLRGHVQARELSGIVADAFEELDAADFSHEALEAIAALGGGPHEPLIRKLLENRDRVDQTAALRALSESCGESCADLLLERIESTEDVSEATAAAVGLCYLRDAVRLERGLPLLLDRWPADLDGILLELTYDLSTALYEDRGLRFVAQAALRYRPDDERGNWDIVSLLRPTADPLAARRSSSLISNDRLRELARGAHGGRQRKFLHELRDLTVEAANLAIADHAPFAPLGRTLIVLAGELADAERMKRYSAASMDTASALVLAMLSRALRGRDPMRELRALRADPPGLLELAACDAAWVDAESFRALSSTAPGDALESLAATGDGEVRNLATHLLAARDPEGRLKLELAGPGRWLDQSLLPWIAAQAGDRILPRLADAYNDRPNPATAIAFVKAVEALGTEAARAFLEANPKLLESPDLLVDGLVTAAQGCRSVPSAQRIAELIREGKVDLSHLEEDSSEGGLDLQMDLEMLFELCDLQLDAGEILEEGLSRFESSELHEQEEASELEDLWEPMPHHEHHHEHGEACAHPHHHHHHHDPAHDGPVEPIVRESPKVGRNDPCPCGSGKKFKKCCGKE